MAEGEAPHGYKVIGTITSVKGHCNAEHKVGNKFEINTHNVADLCGWFYYNIFPNVVMP
jgi:uncharacterized repeat protein (TIGR04076 family)